MAYKTNIASITESGPLTYKQLQQANAQNFNAPTETTETSEYEGLVPTYRAPRKATDYIYEGGERSPLQQSGNGYWGDSMFDNPSASENGYTLEGLTDARANNQPTIAKWAAGATKMLGKAATTFVDGTMGLIYGLGSIPEEGGRLSALWDNDFTNQVSEIDRGLENLLPNYRTTEEQDNMWYQNLGTANLWADSFLKNIGFTIGAMYSGGAWTKALKALGLIQKGLTAGVVGSTISAVNEARMEANNNIHDLRELHYKKLDDAFDQRYNEIINSVYLSDSEKQAALGELYKNTELQRAKIEDDIANAGAITFWGNTALLSLGNYVQFGKLYARGFKSSKGLSAGINDAVRQEATKELGDNIVRNAGKYAWENISNGKAIRRGLLNGATEGNEEMAQALISSTAGYTIDPDSPDAYYKSLLDPKAEHEVRSLASSIFMGLKDSYLSMDKWEEGAIGFLTGILGVPTVGKVQNSSSETYLGRGHTIGLSGGLFGEITRAHDINRRGQEAVDVMNRYVDKLQNQENHFIRSQSFTNAMDGWAAADNAYEYKNAEDNDDFMAISRFAQTGRLGDLKEMVNQDFDNLSDEELAKIAMYTSPNTTLGEDGTVPNTDENGKPIKGGWRNRADGTLMSDTEEGRAEMRKKLNAKRDKILKEIDRYEDSVETARAISNDGLSEDQINELAWLHWKIGAFAERYDSIKKEQTSFLDALQKGVDGFLNGNERLMLDESTEEGKNIAKAMENLSKFLNALRNSESPIQLARYIKANPKMLEFISEFAYPMLEDTTINVDPQKFEEGIKSLEDITKIADAADSFQKKFKEYREDPLGIARNREKINKEKETVRRETDKAQRDSKVNNATVSDLVNAALDGNTNLQDLKDEVVGGSLAELNASVAEYNKNNGKESKSSTTKKVETAEDIINTGNAVKNNIQKQVEEGSITQEEADRAKERVDAATRSANSVEEVTDLNGYYYNDPMFNTATDSLPEGASHEDLEKWVEKAVEKDKEIIKKATYGLQETNEALDKIPDSAESSNESNDDTTGHSGTATIPDAQDVMENQKKLEEERKAKEEAERQRLVLDMSKVSETLKESVVAFHEFIDNLDGAVKEQFIKDLDFIKDRIVRCLEQGLSAKDTINIITELDQYTNLSKMTTLVDSYIVAFTTSKKAEIEESKKEEAEVKKAEEKRTNVNTTTEEEVKTYTPAITLEEAKNDANDLNRNLNGNSDDTKRYWKPTTTRIGIHNPKGDNTPYWEVAQIITTAIEKARHRENLTEQESIYYQAYVAPGYIKNGYSKEELRRMKAVGEYLERNGVFEYVDNGNVKVGSEVTFFIDSELNTAAGEIVILMKDKNGHIIGDVASPKSASFNKQSGLAQAVKTITEEYESAGRPATFESEKVKTTVARNMIGKVPFTNEYLTLNDIFSGDSDGFKLCIALESGKNSKMMMTPNRTQKQGLSEEDKSIMPPLDAKAGQPYVVINTNGSRYSHIAVPIVMEPYNENTANTKLGKRIEAALSKIANADNNTVLPIVDEIEELLSIKGIYIRYTEDDKVVVKLLGHNAKEGDNYAQIYKGSKNDPNLVESLKAVLYGTPFQIPRRLLNDPEFNSMVGEIAKTNLPKGATHTINEWFVLNPLNEQGEEVKAKAPKTVGKNTNAIIANAPISLNYNGVNLNVNTKTWEVTDNNGEVYSGPKTDIVKAYAFGMHKLKNMEKPYDTEWGFFDPVAEKFVDDTEKASDKMVFIGSALDGKGLKRKFGSTEFVNEQAESALDPRILDNNTTGVKVTTHNIGKSNKTIITYFGGTSGHPSIYSRGDGMTIVLHRTISAEEEAAIFDYLDRAKDLIGKETEVAENIVSMLKAHGKVSTTIDKVSSDSNQTTSDSDKLVKLVEDAAKTSTATFGADILKQQKIGEASIDGVSYGTSKRTLKGTLKATLKDNGITFSIDGNSSRIKIKGSDWVTSEQKTNQYGQSATIGITKDDLEKWNKDFGIGKDTPFVVTRIFKSPADGKWYAEGYFELGESFQNKKLPAYVELSPSFDINQALASHKEVVNKMYEEKQTIASEKESKKEVKPSNSEELLSEEEATSIVKDLLDSDTKEEVWKLLSPEQKSFIARKKNPRFRDTALVKLTAELSNGKFNKDVDTILGIKKVDKPKYRRVEGNSVEGIIDDEVKWLSKALPQFSNDDHLTIVRGVSSLATDDGGYAWGQFSTGLITVAEYASKGTLYHEAFHAVVDTLLTDSEYEELFNLGKELYGNIGDLDIEENLAEDFRRFMQSGSDYYVDYMEAKDVSTPIIHSIVKLFRKLSMLTGILRNNTMYLNKIYSDISRGKYANRVINSSTSTKYRMVEGYEFTVERIQRTVDSVVNNANKTAVSRNKAWGELADSILEDGYKIRGKRINGKWVVTSVTQVNNPRYNERIKQHHRDKLMYGNLSEEDRNYISDRGISIEEYNRMSQTEKEILFHCKY